MPIDIENMGSKSMEVVTLEELESTPPPAREMSPVEDAPEALRVSSDVPRGWPPQRPAGDTTVLSFGHWIGLLAERI